MGIRSQNNPLAAYLDVFSNTGTDAVTPASQPGGHTASGGVISDFTSGSDVYRAHIFTSSGTLTVTEGSTTADILIVGAGGGGGFDRGGGGGGGAFVELTGQPITPGS